MVTLTLQKEVKQKSAFKELLTKLAAKQFVEYGSQILNTLN